MLALTCLIIYGRTGKHTAGDVRSLSKELVLMTREKIPLIWSTSDVQTLVNSFIEDMYTLSDPDSELSWEHDFDLFDAWRDLFSTLRLYGEILGDEIHAIMVSANHRYTLCKLRSI